MRTSRTHPLQIAAIQPQQGFGKIGITFCPGKKQPGAMTGGRDRDLGIDLDAVQAFGAAAVLTLIEEHEMRALGVEGLGTQVAARHMDWLHLPIRDVPRHEPKYERLIHHSKAPKPKSPNDHGRHS
ncbi:hypothetical protein [Erythrobacter tepidarius]|uniref:hypothetical protein n=1 Tax=Erythrobacter tepidarius TaxID=60454 RepID=UPI000A378AC1|nr:hypothetical protein [Erythrobacter tepidarius]